MRRHVSTEETGLVISSWWKTSWSQSDNTECDVWSWNWAEWMNGIALYILHDDMRKVGVSNGTNDEFHLNNGVWHKKWCTLCILDNIRKCAERKKFNVRMYVLQKLCSLKKNYSTELFRCELQRFERCSRTHQTVISSRLPQSYMVRHKLFSSFVML